MTIPTIVTGASSGIGKCTAEQILKSKRGRPTPDLKVLEDLINN